MSTFHVLIAGAGIGGLCLAQGLRRAGISYAVYERDPAAGYGGSTLKVNGDGGQALRACLPPPLYQLYQRTSSRTPDRELYVGIDQLGRELGARPHLGSGGSSLAHTVVDRGVLRRILLSGLADTVHFGREATGYQLDTGQVRLAFADGTSVTGDVLVAADGINSVIRRHHLPEARIVDTGIRTLSAKAPLRAGFGAEPPPALREATVTAVTDAEGHSFIFTAFDPREDVVSAAAELAPRCAIGPAPGYWQVGMELLPHGESQLRLMSDDDLHGLMIRAVRQWHPGLRALVAEACRRPVHVRRLRMLEPVAPWLPSRVTFVGDAIHAMLPYLGAGANTALRDAALLTTRLIEHAEGEPGLLTSIAQYEDEMRDYAYPIVRASARPGAQDARIPVELLGAAL